MSIINIFTNSGIHNSPSADLRILNVEMSHFKNSDTVCPYFKGCPTFKLKYACGELYFWCTLRCVGHAPSPPTPILKLKISFPVFCKLWKYWICSFLLHEKCLLSRLFVHLSLQGTFSFFFSFISFLEKIYSEWPPPPSDLANARQAMKNNSNNSLEATEKSMPQIPRCCTLPSRRKNILLHPELELKTSQDSTYGSFCGMKLPPDCEIYHVLLEKDSVYEDFGFSVSDGLYEKGVFVNRIRKGGPAEASGILKPFDRILQVKKINS